MLPFGFSTPDDPIWLVNNQPPISSRKLVDVTGLSHSPPIVYTTTYLPIAIFLYHHHKTRTNIKPITHNQTPNPNQPQKCPASHQPVRPPPPQSHNPTSQSHPVPKVLTPTSPPIATSTQINNLASSNKPPGAEGAPKVKPCCVCKEEKAARDECMLFSTAKDPQAACADMVTKYRACMKGFGFDLA
jgi:cytochrome c oxidase assembly protein subunit 17